MSVTPASLKIPLEERISVEGCACAAQRFSIHRRHHVAEEGSAFACTKPQPKRDAVVCRDQCAPAAGQESSYNCLSGNVPYYGDHMSHNLNSLKGVISGII